MLSKEVPLIGHVSAHSNRVHYRYPGMTITPGNTISYLIERNPYYTMSNFTAISAPISEARKMRTTITSRTASCKGPRVSLV